MSKLNKAAKHDREEDDAPNTRLGKPEVNFLDAEPKSGDRVSEMKLLQEIVKYPMCIRNRSYPEAKETFPFQPELQTIDRFFPLAACGELYVDRAEDESDVKACEIKRKVMKKHKLRYLVIRTDMKTGEVLTDMFNAMEQIEG